MNPVHYEETRRNIKSIAEVKNYKRKSVLQSIQIKFLQTQSPYISFIPFIMKSV